MNTISISEMDFHNMKRNQLQKLCKKHKLPANLTNLEMADNLSSLLKIQEKGKPMRKTRSCLKDCTEILSENESDVLKRKQKKVRFSPENDVFQLGDKKTQLYEFEKVKRGRPKKRGVDDKGDLVVENMGGAGRITRARASFEGKKVLISSPVVMKKRAKRAVQVDEKSGDASFQVVDLNCCDAEDRNEVITVKFLRNRKVEDVVTTKNIVRKMNTQKRSQSISAGDTENKEAEADEGITHPKTGMRKSTRNVKISEKSELLNEDLGNNKMIRSKNIASGTCMGPAADCENKSEPKVKSDDVHVISRKSLRTRDSKNTSSKGKDDVYESVPQSKELLRRSRRNMEATEVVELPRIDLLEQKNARSVKGSMRGDQTNSETGVADDTDHKVLRKNLRQSTQQRNLPKGSIEDVDKKFLAGEIAQPEVLPKQSMRNRMEFAQIEPVQEKLVITEVAGRRKNMPSQNQFHAKAANRQSGNRDANQEANEVVFQVKEPLRRSVRHVATQHTNFADASELLVKSDESTRCQTRFAGKRMSVMPQSEKLNLAKPVAGNLGKRNTVVKDSPNQSTELFVLEKCSEAGHARNSKRNAKRDDSHSLVISEDANGSRSDVKKSMTKKRGRAAILEEEPSQHTGRHVNRKCNNLPDKLEEETIVAAEPQTRSCNRQKSYMHSAKKSRMSCNLGLDTTIGEKVSPHQSTELSMKPESSSASPIPDLKASAKKPESSSASPIPDLKPSAKKPESSSASPRRSETESKVRRSKRNAYEADLPATSGDANGPSGAGIVDTEHVSVVEQHSKQLTHSVGKRNTNQPSAKKPESSSASPIPDLKAPPQQCNSILGRPGSVDSQFTFPSACTSHPPDSSSGDIVRDGSSCLTLQDSSMEASVINPHLPDAKDLLFTGEAGTSTPCSVKLQIGRDLVTPVVHERSRRLTRSALKGKTDGQARVQGKIFQKKPQSLSKLPLLKAESTLPKANLAGEGSLDINVQSSYQEVKKITVNIVSTTSDISHNKTACSTPQGSSSKTNIVDLDPQQSKGPELMNILEASEPPKVQSNHAELDVDISACKHAPVERSASLDVQESLPQIAGCSTDPVSNTSNICTDVDACSTVQDSATEVYDKTPGHLKPNEGSDVAGDVASIVRHSVDDGFSSMEKITSKGMEVNLQTVNHVLVEGSTIHEEQSINHLAFPEAGCSTNLVSKTGEVTSATQQENSGETNVASPHLKPDGHFNAARDAFLIDTDALADFSPVDQLTSTRKEDRPQVSKDVESISKGISLNFDSQGPTIHEEQPVYQSPLLEVIGITDNHVSGNSNTACVTQQESLNEIDAKCPPVEHLKSVENTEAIVDAGSIDAGAVDLLNVEKINSLEVGNCGPTRQEYDICNHSAEFAESGGPDKDSGNASKEVGEASSVDLINGTVSMILMEENDATMLPEISEQADEPHNTSSKSGVQEKGVLATEETSILDSALSKPEGSDTVTSTGMCSSKEFAEDSKHTLLTVESCLMMEETCVNNHVEASTLKVVTDSVAVGNNKSGPKDPSSPLRVTKVGYVVAEVNEELKPEASPSLWTSDIIPDRAAEDGSSLHKQRNSVKSADVYEHNQSKEAKDESEISKEVGMFDSSISDFISRTDAIKDEKVEETGPCTMLTGKAVIEDGIELSKENSSDLVGDMVEGGGGYSEISDKVKPEDHNGKDTIDCHQFVDTFQQSELNFGETDSNLKGIDQKNAEREILVADAMMANNVEISRNSIDAIDTIHIFDQEVAASGVPAEELPRNEDTMVAESLTSPEVTNEAQGVFSTTYRDSSGESKDAKSKYLVDHNGKGTIDSHQFVDTFQQSELNFGETDTNLKGIDQKNAEREFLVADVMMANNVEISRGNIDAIDIIHRFDQEVAASEVPAEELPRNEDAMVADAPSKLQHDGESLASHEEVTNEAHGVFLTILNDSSGESNDAKSKYLVDHYGKDTIDSHQFVDTFQQSELNFGETDTNLKGIDQKNAEREFLVVDVMMANVEVAASGVPAEELPRNEDAMVADAPSKLQHDGESLTSPEVTNEAQGVFSTIWNDSSGGEYRAVGSEEREVVETLFEETVKNDSGRNLSVSGDANHTLDSQLPMERECGLETTLFMSGDVEDTRMDKNISRKTTPVISEDDVDRYRIPCPIVPEFPSDVGDHCQTALTPLKYSCGNEQGASMSMVKSSRNCGEEFSFQLDNKTGVDFMESTARRISRTDALNDEKVEETGLHTMVTGKGVIEDDIEVLKGNSSDLAGDMVEDGEGYCEISDEVKAEVNTSAVSEEDHYGKDTFDSDQFVDTFQNSELNFGETDTNLKGIDQENDVEEGQDIFPVSMVEEQLRYSIDSDQVVDTFQQSDLNFCETDTNLKEIDQENDVEEGKNNFTASMSEEQLHDSIDSDQFVDTFQQSELNFGETDTNSKVLDQENIVDGVKLTPSSGDVYISVEKEAQGVSVTILNDSSDRGPGELIFNSELKSCVRSDGMDGEKSYFLSGNASFTLDKSKDVDEVQENFTVSLAEEQMHNSGEEHVRERDAELIENQHAASNIPSSGDDSISVDIEAQRVSLTILDDCPGSDEVDEDKSYLSFENTDFILDKNKDVNEVTDFFTDFLAEQQLHNSGEEHARDKGAELIENQPAASNSSSGDFFTDFLAEQQLHNSGEEEHAREKGAELIENQPAASNPSSADFFTDFLAEQQLHNSGEEEHAREKGAELIKNQPAACSNPSSGDYIISVENNKSQFEYEANKDC